MDVKPIKTEVDYESTLEEIDRLFDSEPGTPDGDKLEVLVTLVEAYEAKYHKIPLPDPIEAIEHYMESRGLTRQDLIPYLGSAPRVSEILNRKRSLSLRMIRNLEAAFGIPASILVQKYDLDIAEENIDSDNLLLLFDWEPEIRLNAIPVLRSLNAGYESLDATPRKLTSTIKRGLDLVENASVDNLCLDTEAAVLNWPFLRRFGCAGTLSNQAVADSLLERIH